MRFFLLIGICLLALSAAFNSHSQEQPVQTDQELKKIPLEHFVLWADKKVRRKDLLDTRRNLINVRRQVGKEFGGVYPKYTFDVILTDVDTFRAYSNTPQHVQGLFDGKIHLPVPSEVNAAELKSIMWHEYTHALVWFLSGGRCPIWINEGFGTHSEELINPTRKKYVKRVVRGSGNLLINIQDMEKKFSSFSSLSADEAQILYLQSFAIIDYLKRRYSKAQIRRFIEGMKQDATDAASIKRAFHTTFEGLEKDVVRHILG